MRYIEVDFQTVTLDKGSSHDPIIDPPVYSLSVGLQVTKKKAEIITNNAKLSTLLEQKANVSIGEQLAPCSSKHQSPTSLHVVHNCTYPVVRRRGRHHEL